MRKLLMYFSYIGTNYKGLSRTNSACQKPDIDTVQGVLELGLQKVLWIDNLRLFVSSRTDTKVHALESTAQFILSDSDLAKKSRRPYSPEVICQSLNLFLDKNECDIKINRIVEVDKDFNCRRAYSRVYEFRVAVLNEVPHNFPSYSRLSIAADIKDRNRCEVISQPFDVGIVQQACKLFLGQWNFSTFFKSSREVVPETSRVKTLRRFSLAQEIIQEPDLDYKIPGELSLLSSQPYEVYTFTVEGSGFLRRQVRRMVGALVAVGQGNISPDDILWMLKNPSEENWKQGVQCLGPNGLFLKKINYPNVEVLRGYLS